jgi:hypothetical protein
MQDTCDGTGTCTDNGFQPATTSCGDTGDECTMQDTCDGGGNCTDNGFQPEFLACGDAGTQCTNPDTCDGAGSCTDGGIVTNGTACSDGDVCTEDDVCGAGACISGADICGPWYQTKFQAKCITSLNKTGAKVAAAQGKANTTCVRNFAKDKEVSVTTCLTADPKGKVAKAEAKTLAAENKYCGDGITTIPPDFGYTSGDAVNIAASSNEVALITEVFGVNLDLSIVKSDDDKEGAKCQAAMSKNYERLGSTALKLFMSCKTDGLKTLNIFNPETLAACMDDISNDIKGKMQKARDKLVADVNKNCATGQLDTLFPGTCVGDPDLPDCVARLVSCRICLMINEKDGLDGDCDLFDDATSNLSCGP